MPGIQYAIPAPLPAGSRGCGAAVGTCAHTPKGISLIIAESGYEECPLPSGPDPPCLYHISNRCLLIFYDSPPMPTSESAISHFSSSLPHQKGQWTTPFQLCTPPPTPSPPVPHWGNQSPSQNLIHQQLAAQNPHMGKKRIPPHPHRKFRHRIITQPIHKNQNAPF